MNIFSVLLILAALVLAYLCGMVSIVGTIRKYYPTTHRVLAAELRERQAAREAAGR